jgi:hypothetical protein
MRKPLLVSTLVLLAFAAIAMGAVRSAGASSEDAGNQLAGTWRATVNRPAPLSAITSLGFAFGRAGFGGSLARLQYGRTSWRSSSAHDDKEE